MPLIVDAPRLAALLARLVDRLRGEIAAGGLTVRRLAREIGVSQPHMQNVVSGKRGLSIDVADRLMEYAAITALDLATDDELGWALAQRRQKRPGVETIGVAAGQLGPAHPFPDLRRAVDWIALPALTLPELIAPIFVELSLDEETLRVFPGATLALVDAARGADAEEPSWCAVKWSGGGWVRQVRREGDRLVVLGQRGLRMEQGPQTLAANDVGAAARIVWIGRDPRRVVELEREGYLMPPPEAAS